jgi:hypothetical protein
MRQPNRTLLLQQLRHFSHSTLRPTMSPPLTTTTLYLLLSLCSEFAVLTTTRPEILLCPIREAESPLPPQITTAQVTQPDKLTSLIQTLAAQTQATLQV